MKKTLRDSILSFQIGDSSENLNFKRRLARENNWSDEFVTRAVNEYFKFIVLCSEADHKVTPSDAVDQVWHFHMCYTQNYWNELCGDVLGFPLHHGPTKGGRSEREKFHNWYSKTLESYQRIFAELPPPDIWPSPQSRFSERDFRRIDCGSNFIFPKKVVGILLAGIGATCCLAGCASGLVIASADSISLWLLGLIVFVVVIVALIKRGGGGKGGGSGCGGFFGGCSSDSGCGGGCGGD